MSVSKQTFSMLVTLIAVLAFSISPALAKKPDNTGGGGGGGGNSEFRFTFVDLLGFPDRGYQSSPQFITESDPITGHRFIAGSSRLYPDPEGGGVFHPALWDIASDGSFPDSDPLDLGLPDWANGAQIRGLSDAGVVAASTGGARYQDPEDPSRYLFPAFVMTESGYLQLPTPEERPGWPYGVHYRNSDITAMNNNHLIVGSYEKLVGEEPDGTQLWDRESAMWQLDNATGVIPLPVSLGEFRPTALNDAGVMVGYNGTDTVVYYGLDSGGSPTFESLPNLAGYDRSEPLSISENGEWVAGTAEVYVEGSGWSFEACVWNVLAGTVQGLGTLNTGSNGSSFATGVNDDGQVVGWSDTGRRSTPRAAFLWENGLLTDLNDLVDTGNFQLTRANGISPDGQIIGVLHDQSAREERGFLLQPINYSSSLVGGAVPEPATISYLIILGLVLSSRGRHKRQLEGSQIKG